MESGCSCGSSLHRFESHREGAGKERQHQCFIVFSTTGSLLSKLIRGVTGCPASHVAVVYDCVTTGRMLVMEASGRGFRVLTWEVWIRDNQPQAAFRLKAPQWRWRAALGQFCDVLGADYDTPRLVREMVRHMGRRVIGRFGDRNGLATTQRVLCSDAIARFLLLMDHEECREPTEWTPGALLDLLGGHPAFEAAHVHCQLSSASSAPRVVAESAAAGSPRRHLRLVG